VGHPHQSLGEFALSSQTDARPTSLKETESAYAERHYTVDEIAAIWNMSKDAVRRIFRNEEGVLVLGRKNRSSDKRPYATLRIPESVLSRVHRQLSVGSVNENS
jgi:AraC-like DNA-binding protein